MLTVYVKPIEYYDEKTNMFGNFNGETLCLEHSLLSISKWEAIWHKPFLIDDPKTKEETKSYIKCMTLNKVKDEMAYEFLTGKDYAKISEYIADSMTATTFTEQENKKGGNRGQVITSELIYYWMVSLQIPFEECQKWHLNRLLTLIKICSIKNQPDKKMSKSEIYAQNRALNAARRKRH